MPRHLAAGVAVAAFLAVAVGATYAAPTVEHSPISPHGIWRWVLIGAATAAFTFYLVGLWLLRTHNGSVRAVLAIGAAIQLAPLAAPLLLSTDAYIYWDYGRIGTRYHGNPYADPPGRWPQDEALRKNGPQWVNLKDKYGPTFTLAAEVEAEAVGDNARAAIWGWKITAGIIVVCVAALAGMLGSARAFAAAFVGWNPLLALHFAGGGHNDVWMIAAFVGALALWSRRRPALAGAAWVGAVSFKWVPLLWLPLQAAAHRRDLKARALALAPGVITAAVVVAALSFWRFGTAWLHALSPVGAQLNSVSSTSFPYWISRWAGYPQYAHRLGQLFEVLYALAYVWLLRQAWRGRARLALAAGLLVAVLAWEPPWYTMWVVPLAAVEDDKVARLLALGLTAWLLRDALPLPYFS